MRKLKIRKESLFDFEEPKVQGFDECWDIDEEEVEPDPRRGWILRNLFLASKNLFQRRESKRNGTNSFFDEIAGRLNAWERRTGRQIDDELFVMTMRRRYGEWFYPGHMLGKEALKIYHKGMKEAYRKMNVRGLGI
jgi:hypothetical protein